MTSQPISLIRGQSHTATIRIELGGASLDLATASAATFTARPSEYSPVAKITKALGAGVTAGVAGLATVALTTGDTAELDISNSYSWVLTATVSDVEHIVASGVLTAIGAPQQFPDSGGTSGPVAAADITDAGTAGIAVLQSETAAQVRTAAGLAGLSTTGLIARTGAGTAATRTITGTANQVIVTNGDGVSGNPTLSLPQSIATGSTPTFAGLNVGATVIGSTGVTVNYSGTGNRIAIVDLVGDDTYTDYGLRIIRNSTGANASSEITHRGTGSLNIKTREASDIVLHTNNEARLFIGSAGNVGIGTTAPASKLDLGSGVTGPRIYTYRDAAANSGFGTDLSGGGYENSIFAGGTTDANGRISFGRRRVDTGTYTERMVIDVGTGKVGIGTTNPAATLDVAGSGRFGEAANPGTAYSNGLSVVRPSGTPTSILLWQVGKGLGHVGFKANDSTLYVVNSSADGTIADGKGIAIDTIGNVRLNAYGAGTLVTDSSGNITASSDGRLKNVTGTFSRGLEAVLKLTPRTYRWNEKSGMNTEDENVGFIAQEVLESIPEAVGQYRTSEVEVDGKKTKKREKAELLTLSDRPLIAALVNAVKELKAENDELRKRLDRLETKKGNTDPTHEESSTS